MFVVFRDPNLWTVKCKVCVCVCVDTRTQPPFNSTRRAAHVHSHTLTVFLLQIGEERATAIALMRKFIAYQFTDTVQLELPVFVLFCWWEPLQFPGTDRILSQGTGANWMFSAKTLHRCSAQYFSIKSILVYLESCVDLTGARVSKHNIGPTLTTFPLFFENIFT